MACEPNIYNSSSPDISQAARIACSSCSLFIRLALLYRYFDATKQAEFLYAYVEETVKNILPEEVQYQKCHDEMRTFIAEHFDMPDKDMENLIGFLRQNDGTLSNRARSKEFKALTDEEVDMLEDEFQEIFAH